MTTPTTESAASSANTTLVPSQVKQPTGSTGRNRRNRGRGRRGGGTKQKQEQAKSKSSNEDCSGEAIHDNTCNNASSKPPATQTRKVVNDKKTNDNNNDNNDNQNPKQDDGAAVPTKPKRKRRTRQRGNKNTQQPAWKKLLPKGEVDPISLDPLHQLKYPPFVLAATEPYDATLIFDGAADPQNIKNWHLFDGRVLAYYMISQMQFIDPLNRRDLTFLELQHLDRYLKEHRLLPRGSKGNDVVSAYKSRAGSGAVSSAGQAGQTDRARSERLQREAALILDSLFAQRVGSSSGNRPSSNGNNNVTRSTSRSNFLVEFERQHRAEEERERNRRAARLPNTSDIVQHQQSQPQQQHQHGMVVIDDDEHPELRGVIAAPVARSATRSSARGVLSAGAAPYVPPVPVYAEAFPSLPQSSTPASEALPATAATSSHSANGNNTTEQATQRKPSAASSLGRISNMVQKTNPAQLERQRRARLDAQRRAAMSQLTFEEQMQVNRLQNHQQQNSEAQGTSSSSDVGRTGKATIDATENMLERNQRFANALGIAPSTVRNKAGLVGWARPTTTARSDFCDELTAADYPDSLIVDAKENLALVLKIEKQWTAFLNNDKDKSFQCKPMEKPKRKLVHEYSDFWFLHTESFDPAPYRYVNCVKTADTKMPYPLLSAAVKSWRGPRLELLASVGNDVPAHESVSLAPTKTGAPETSLLDRMGNDVGTKAVPKERPKLQLALRTLPTELPPFVSEKQKREEARLKRQKEVEESKKNAEAQEKIARTNLFDAFDSDDDDDDGSVWSEPSALYQSEGEDE
eukprot:CAMPEP_0116018570 /NCGR_PEP_ID=MMETSP0321-20121206/8721_1 /TAXON_ID=163516 /ORGANISM="Leptocylindrus danicus var. danicus, Strain B650" /LENGTH=803 /DNA_ID=CAMNT_0003488977 /DNA_START=15 /DNA_END=2426 /DNA_ORIENTATION=+